MKSCPHKPRPPQHIPLASLLLAPTMLAPSLILERAEHFSSSKLPTCSPHAWLLLSLHIQLKYHLLGWTASWWFFSPLNYSAAFSVPLIIFLALIIYIILRPKLFFWLISCFFGSCLSHSIMYLTRCLTHRCSISAEKQVNV